MACCGISPQKTGEKVIWITHKDRFFKFFDLLSTHTIDQKDPYLGTGKFTVTIPLPNSLSSNLEGGFRNFEKKIMKKTNPVLYYYFLKRNISYSDVYE